MGKGLISIIILFWYIPVFAIEENKVKKSDKTEKNFSTILDNKKIGFCSTDGKQNFIMVKDWVEQLLDEECVSKNFMFSKSIVSEEEVLNGNFEFYDNCINKIESNGDELLTGKIYYKYYFSCEPNSSLINEFIRMVPLKNYNNFNNSSFYQYSDIRNFDHPCNTTTFGTRITLNQRSAYKYEKLDISAPSRLNNFVRNFLKIPKNKKITLHEFYSGICFLGFKHNLLIIAVDDQGLMFIDLDSIERKNNKIIYDKLDMIYSHGKVYGSQYESYEYSTAIIREQLDCDDPLKEPQQLNFLERVNFHQRGGDREATKQQKQQSIKIYKKQQELGLQPNEIAFQINRGNTLCRFANNENMKDTFFSYWDVTTSIIRDNNLDSGAKVKERKVARRKLEKFYNSEIINQFEPKNFTENYIKQNYVAKNYYGRVNNFFSDPGMQQAILTLNEAQFYFLKALGEDQAAIAAGMYAQNLKQGSALGKDSLQKILVQTKEQQLLINRKIQEGYVLSFEAKQTFSNGIPYYTRGIAILTIQGFNSYDIFNVINSNTNLFVKILSGFSLFLKVKDALVAIPLFLSSTADIFNYASQNDIENTDELRKAKDSLGV